MSKKKWTDDDDDKIVDPPPGPDIPYPPPAMEVPEGMDEAIYKQGFDAGLKWASSEHGPREDLPSNAFTVPSPQADTWQAGFDAGTVLPPELTPLTPLK